MEQRCTILNLYLNWLLYLGGATFFLATGRYLFFFVWAWDSGPERTGAVGLPAIEFLSQWALSSLLTTRKHLGKH